MNLLGLFHLPTAVVVALIAANGIPYLTALVHRQRWPSFALGLTTMVLSVADGFFSTWAASPDAADYDWKAAVGVSISAFFIAAVQHSKVLKGTGVEAALLAAGNRTTAPATPTT